MRLDQAGRDLIKGFETLRLTVYQDGAGVWTIGWGHTDGVEENTPEITPDQAETFFEDDIAPCESCVRNWVTVPISQNEFNALVSFAFNEGEGAFQRSTLLQKLNRGDKQGAAKEFDRWVYEKDPKTGELEKSAGLVNRRAKERVLFSQGFLAVRGSIPEAKQA